MPNSEVLAKASRQPLTKTLQIRQVLLFGRIALLPDTSMVRRVCFTDGDVAPRQFPGGRKRGRPRHTWIQTAYALALEVCKHDVETLHEMLCSSEATFERWKSLLIFES